MTQNQHDGACVREESLTVAPTTLIDQHRDGNRLEGGVRQEVSAMHRSPVVSVVIVVYRDRGEVEALLENLKTFRRSEVEVVIIDGGSDDGTLEVLRKNSDCIDYWLSEPDEGIYDAMNKGIAAAQGEYVIHLNAGDRLLCVPFAALKACSTRNVDVLCCGVLDEGCKSFMPRRSVLSKIRNGWHHQGTFYRRTGFLGYDKSYRVYGDFDHNLRLAKKCVIVEYSDAIVASHGSGGVSSNKRHFEEVFRSVRRNHGIGAVVLSFLYFKCHGLRRRCLRFWG